MAKRLTMNTRKGKPFSEVWGEFITSQTAKGVAEITLRNYRQVLHNITRFFDVETPMDELSKSDFEEMVVEMRGEDLAHNTIATYSTAKGGFSHAKAFLLPPVELGVYFHT